MLVQGKPDSKINDIESEEYEPEKKTNNQKFITFKTASLR